VTDSIGMDTDRQDKSEPGWHLNPDMIRSYGNTATFGLAASMESHLLRCTPCQRAAALAVPGDRLDRNWQAVSRRIDTPAHLRRRPGRPAVPALRLARFGVATLAAATLATAPAWQGAPHRPAGTSPAPAHQSPGRPHPSVV